MSAMGGYSDRVGLELNVCFQLVVRIDSVFAHRDIGGGADTRIYLDEMSACVTSGFFIGNDRGHPLASG